MIHSLSGGVLADNGIYFFVKVKAEGADGWYLAPRPLAAGVRVLVPCAREGSAEGVVLRAESCTPHTAPVPVRRARSILRVLGDGAKEG